MTTVRIGIDVGGTNTDVVAVDSGGNVVTWHKTPTTATLFDGIGTGLAAVLARVRPADVSHVMLGTTHPVNALIARSNLARVGVLRIGAPATLSISPLADWPRDLADLVCAYSAIVRGGHEFDGSEMGPLDEDAVRAFAKACGATVDVIALTGVHSPANPAHEIRAGQILAEELGQGFPITLGHQIGGLGLLERENSATLNAALRFVGAEVVAGLEQALSAHDLRAEIYMTQNDGTLLSAAEAARRPVMTIGSGPTNSMRGAAHLSGLTDAIIMDVGGTSTDVGMLVGGFPRESALPVEIGGVRTNYRMPDLISVGLGGGTVVRADERLRIGPDSVAHRLTERARVFGGDTLTLTDVSVLAGRLTAGEPGRAADVPRSLAEQVVAWVDDQIGALADRIKVARSDLPLVAVGGGAHLIPDEIPGVSAVHRHEYASVANAIGAAIAEASGTLDRTFQFSVGGREACLETAKRAAVDAAVRAGADPAGVRITSVTEIPLSYLPGDSVRVQVKATGPLT
ncbi:hydantoinase/oxoprolinase family protein [Nonomuraea longicatena]|uniref:Hydantoinase/oxoprolinase family protein n=1 Tax=Nonomuraea longicatena TaxID=83682 RepID=A0ABN1Q990_9ACTN